MFDENEFMKQTNVEKISKLQDIANTLGLSLFTNEYINLVRYIINNIKKQPILFLITKQNTVTLEYENNNEDILQLEILADLKIKELIAVSDLEYINKYKYNNIVFLNSNHINIILDDFYNEMN